MVLKILSELADQRVKGKINEVLERQAGLLFNEVYFQIMDQVIGRDPTGDVLRACLGTKGYSKIHRFIAWTMQHFNRPVQTTNFAELIEEAIAGTHSPQLIQQFPAGPNPF